jgi:hypothetical protein
VEVDERQDFPRDRILAISRWTNLLLAHSLAGDALIAQRSGGLAPA